MPWHIHTYPHPILKYFRCPRTKISHFYLKKKCACVCACLPVCLSVCFCVYDMCAWGGQRTLAGHLCLSPSLSQSCIFATVDGRVAGSWAAEASPVSTFHLLRNAKIKDTFYCIQVIWRFWGFKLLFSQLRNKCSVPWVMYSYFVFLSI